VRAIEMRGRCSSQSSAGQLHSESVEGANDQLNGGRTLTIFIWVAMLYFLYPRRRRMAPVPTRMPNQIALEISQDSGTKLIKMGFSDIGTLSRFCCWLRLRAALSNKTRRI
jgi:hypothetical protein